jgi:hypothetical protein
MNRPIKSCDFAKWRRDQMNRYAEALKKLHESVSEPTHFYTSVHSSISDALLLQWSLQKYTLLKPLKWIEAVD